MSAGAALLHTWDSFYVIVGSSAAALTGLMFVVISLIPDARERLGGSSATVSAFSSPTVVHFCMALLVSATLSAPWPRLHDAGIAIAAAGSAGIVYALVVIQRMRAVREYAPVWQDWAWHGALPLAAYAAIDVGGILALTIPVGALFLVATGTLTLLFIGIHNAWDTVVYVAFERRPEPKPPAGPPPRP